MRIRAIIVLAGCLAVAGSGARADPSAIALQEPWSNLFGGKEAVLHATLQGEAFEGRVAWELSAAGRTLARGECAVRTAAGERGTVEIRLAVPEVNPGVIMAMKLAVSAIGGGADKVVGSVQRDLWAFPSDPFTGRSEWLKALDIRLFDSVGATAKVFDEAKVSYTAVRNMDALGPPGNGLLVVGEGVSFRDYRGLGDSLIKAAADGWPVLCLAPAGGAVTIPLAVGAELPEPKGVALRRQDIIPQLDKRLDADGWMADGKASGSGLKLTGNRGPIVAEVVGQSGAWPWLDMTFDKGRGKLVICSFGIVGGWAESPTPRFLFVKVLEYVSGSRLRE